MVVKQDKWKHKTGFEQYQHVTNEWLESAGIVGLRIETSKKRKNITRTTQRI